MGYSIQLSLKSSLFVPAPLIVQLLDNREINGRLFFLIKEFIQLLARSG
jgi:hypothetical protein